MVSCTTHLTATSMGLHGALLAAEHGTCQDTYPTDQMVQE
jgi:hypothetical protein